MRFRGTKGQLLMLREYMTKNGIPYEKALVFESGDEAAVFMRRRNIAGPIHSLVFIA
jgi:hypothetical protein